MSKKTRIIACKLAAQVIARRSDRDLIPDTWSLAVFFEEYIEKGAKKTLKDFGPKDPVQLRSVLGEKQK